MSEKSDHAAAAKPGTATPPPVLKATFYFDERGTVTGFFFEPAADDDQTKTKAAIAAMHLGHASFASKFQVPGFTFPLAKEGK